MAELADASALEAGGSGRVGSSPTRRTRAHGPGRRTCRRRPETMTPSRAKSGKSGKSGRTSGFPGTVAAAHGGALLAAAAAGYWGVGMSASPLLRPVFGRSVLWRAEVRDPLVALTFDDGPDPERTARFLAALEEAPATFFVLGGKARTWPGLVGALAAAGHEVACHGWDHRSLAGRGPASTVRGLRMAREAIEDAAGPPHFFRPPYGVFNLTAWAVAPRLGMRRTLWSGWAKDWSAGATPASIAAATLRAARPGAVLLLHDAEGEPGAPDRTLAALPAILAGFAERGLTPVRLSDLVGAERDARGAAAGPGGRGRSAP